MKTFSLQAVCIAAMGLASFGVPFAAQAQHVALAVVVPGPAYVPPPVIVVRPPVYVARPVYMSPPAAVYIAPGPTLLIGWHNNQYWDGHRYWGRDEYAQFHHGGDYHGYHGDYHGNNGYGHRPY